MDKIASSPHVNGKRSLTMHACDSFPLVRRISFQYERTSGTNDDSNSRFSCTVGATKNSGAWSKLYSNGSGDGGSTVNFLCTIHITPFCPLLLLSFAKTSTKYKNTPFRSLLLLSFAKTSTKLQEHVVFFYFLKGTFSALIPILCHSAHMHVQCRSQGNLVFLFLRSIDQSGLPIC